MAAIENFRFMASLQLFLLILNIVVIVSTVCLAQESSLAKQKQPLEQKLENGGDLSMVSSSISEKKVSPEIGTVAKTSNKRDASNLTPKSSRAPAASSDKIEQASKQVVSNSDSAQESDDKARQNINKQEATRRSSSGNKDADKALANNSAKQSETSTGSGLAKPTAKISDLQAKSATATSKNGPHDLTEAAGHKKKKYMIVHKKKKKPKKKMKKIIIHKKKKKPKKKKKYVKVHVKKPKKKKKKVKYVKVHKHKKHKKHHHHHHF